MFHDTQLAEVAARIQALPDGPAPDKTTDKYMFLDTKRVAQDMADLGFVPVGFRRPNFRTQAGAYSLHEVDFRRPEHIQGNEDITPRILFLNSYDGSRKAMFAAGVFRLACLNGLVVGDVTHHRQKILHLGDYVEELMAEIREMAKTHTKTFDRIEKFRSIELDAAEAARFAKEAIALRFEDEATRPEIDPRNMLHVRRREDLSRDLWTRFNVVQENLIKGGVPLVNSKGQARLAPPVQNIQRSNDLNQDLWNLAERFAEAA